VASQSQGNKAKVLFTVITFLGCEKAQEFANLHALKNDDRNEYDLALSP